MMTKNTTLCTVNDPIRVCAQATDTNGSLYDENQSISHGTNYRKEQSLQNSKLRSAAGLNLRFMSWFTFLSFDLDYFSLQRLSHIETTHWGFTVGTTCTVMDGLLPRRNVHLSCLWRSCERSVVLRCRLASTVIQKRVCEDVRLIW